MCGPGLAPGGSGGNTVGVLRRQFGTLSSPRGLGHCLHTPHYSTPGPEARLLSRPRQITPVLCRAGSAHMRRVGPRSSHTSLGAAHAMGLQPRHEEASGLARYQGRHVAPMQAQRHKPQHGARGCDGGALTATAMGGAHAAGGRRDDEGAAGLTASGWTALRLQE